MFAMVLLTCAVFVALFRARVKSVVSGEVRGSYFKTYRGGEEPDASIQLSRHFANIFETPTLFYAACLAAMTTGQSSLLLHVLAWMYVVLRLAHAHIHIGSNKLRPRMFVYFTSWLVLLLMWGLLTIGVWLGT